MVATFEVELVDPIINWPEPLVGGENGWIEEAKEVLALEEVNGVRLSLEKVESAGFEAWSLVNFIIFKGVLDTWARAPVGGMDCMITDDLEVELSNRMYLSSRQRAQMR